MTREEVNNISFKPNSHMSLEDEHCITYTATYKNHGFGICDHQPYRNGQPKGKSYRHYMVDGKVFKTKEKFYQYIESL